LPDSKADLVVHLDIDVSYINSSNGARYNFGRKTIEYGSISNSILFAAMLMLLWCLHRQLGGLPWREWSLPILGLIGASRVAGLACWATSWGCQYIWGTEGMLMQLLQLCLAGSVGLGVFAVLVSQLKLPEVELLFKRLRQC
jgi:putative peptidoglycan lipid II flippase